MAAPHIPPASTNVDLAKRVARARGLAARVGCDPAWGERLARHVLAELPPPLGAVVSGFWPMTGEIDLRPLLTVLHARGHAVLLPETPPLGNPLIFRHWRPGAEMLRERFGTWRPTGEVAVPGVLFIPLVAFDRAGRRLGYGGGYYDRWLAANSHVVGIGVAWSFAQVDLDVFAARPHDVPLALIVTEAGVV